MTSEPKTGLARAAMPLTEHVVYLDTGSVGPVTSVYAGMLARGTAEDLRIGRASRRRFDRIDAATEALRTEISGLLGARPSEIELTQGTADAIRILVDRYPWQPGDEIVSTQLEYPACANAITDLAKTGRVTLRTAAVPDQSTDDLGWLERCVSPRTRLIAFSAVAYTTGQRLPVERIVEFASALGIHTLVDGAQLIGAAALGLDEVPIDFLAMPLQKWLCGPEGLGALFVRDGAGSLAPGRKYVVHGWPVLEAAVAQLSWMRDTLGWPWIYERVRTLHDYARSALSDCHTVKIVTPDASAGLLSFKCEPAGIKRILERFETDRLVVRHRRELDLFRFSTAFFNTEEEIHRGVASLQ
jgi:L-cysteine/cystine lyase